MRYSMWYRRLWTRFRWLPMPRYLFAKPTSPNFLFSRPPYVEWGGYSWIVVIGPNGRANSELMKVASERLRSVGGGLMRKTPGQFIFESDFI